MAEKIADQGRREFDTMSHELSEKLRENFARTDRIAQQRIDALEKRVAVLEKFAGMEAGAAATGTNPPPAGSPPL